MEIPSNSILLRIFIGEDQPWHHLALHEAIVMKAREMNLAGATVLRAIGFNKSNGNSAHRAFRISSESPFIVEMIDSAEKIHSFLPILNEMMKSGFVTLETVQVIHLST